MYNNSEGDERSLVAGLLWRLSPDAQDRFNACKASHRFMSYRDKDLIIYEIVADKRKVITTLSCRSIAATIQDGMTSVWSSSAGPDMTVGQIPVEVSPSVFMWHTFHTDLRYIPYRGVYSARFSMLYKCPHHPKFRQEGVPYIQERATYELELAA